MLDVIHKDNKPMIANNKEEEEAGDEPAEDDDALNLRIVDVMKQSE